MESKILEILKSIRPDSDFEASEDFIEDFLLDSFDIINLANDLQTTFGIKINSELIVPENFETIPAIARMIRQIEEA
ncbi:MAG: acyl carrier protein [Eubacterium sp.]|nr:acyl carrier protein [Eubacterium sp.]